MWTRKISENINRKIIRHYTRESGVRNLEREISKIARKTVKKLDAKEKTNNPLKEADLKKYLGVEKFNYGEIEDQNCRGSCRCRKKTWNDKNGFVKN